MIAATSILALLAASLPAPLPATLRIPLRLVRAAPLQVLSLVLLLGAAPLPLAEALASPPPATPPVRPPARVVGSSPLEAPPASASDGATVLGQAESAEAAEAAARLAAIPPPPAPRLSDDPRRRSLMTLHEHLFPPPLTEAELDAWCVAVGLGPEAVAHARAVLEGYATRLRAFPANDSLSLVLSSFQWSDSGERLDPLWTPVHVAMLVRRREYLDALRNAENQVLASLLPLVHSERQAEARRLMFRRQFRIEAPAAPDSLAGIDPVSLVAELELTEADLARVAPLIDQYVREMDLLLRRRRAAILDGELQRAQLEMGLGPHWEVLVPAEERTGLAWELDNLKARRDEIDRPLRQANRALLQAIAERLLPPKSVVFADRLIARLPPGPFVEERTLAQLLEASLATPELDKGALEGREALQAAARRRLLPLGLEHAEIGDELAAMPTGKSGDLSEDRAAAVARLEAQLRRMEVARRRRAICLESADSLKVLLTPREATLAAAIDQYKRELTMQSSAEGWLARQMRDRSGEIRLREREDREAAEEQAAMGAAGSADDPTEANGPRPPNLR